jgi:hypothetical protein
MKTYRDGGQAVAVALSKGGGWHDARLAVEGRHERQDARRGGPGGTGERRCAFCDERRTGERATVAERG